MKFDQGAAEIALVFTLSIVCGAALYHFIGDVGFIFGFAAFFMYVFYLMGRH